MPVIHRRNCDTCKKFYVGSGKRFCSRECRPPWNKGSKGVQKPYWLGKKRTGQGIGLWMKGKKWSESQRKKMEGRFAGEKNPNFGRVFSKEVRKRMGDSKRGRVTSQETKEKLRLAHLGAKSHLWKGGISPLNKIIRRSLGYRIWREAVFKRDDWTCQNCKIRGGELHPHHIKPFAYFPELRFEISNGVTLCAKCHKLTDSYAGKGRKHGN